MFKTKSCSNCNTEFTPSGPAGKYCPSCAKLKKLAANRRGSYNHKLRNNLIIKPGVGSGGNNSKGREDTQFKTGIMYFQRIRSEIRERRRYCENCSKDLLDANRYQWVIHHIDHDRTNNTESNFKLLCKRCHQIEHECHKAFEGVTTREKSRKT